METKPNSPEAKALSEMQRPRVTDEDCQILSIFKDDEHLVLAVRNLFLGFELSEREESLIIDRLGSEGVQKVLRKMFLPELDPKIPVGQNVDLWTTTDVTEATEETFDLVYATKSKFIEMIETSLKKIEDLSNPGVDLTPAKDLAFLNARIRYINHTTKVLYDIVMNANRLVDPLAIIKKNKANSSK